MARDPSQTEDIGQPMDDGVDPFAEGGELLGSAGITDTGKVSNPAAYDEELADAKLVEAGIEEGVPGVHEDEVTREGIAPVADTTGSAIATPGGGDMTAAFGGPVTGDPDNPDNVDTSVVPEGYETDEEE